MLSNAEIRRLRSQLNSLTMTRDLVVELPTEILLQIIDYLDLEDWITACYVSHGWKHTWSHPDICILIIKNHFRSVFERSYKSLREIDQKASMQALITWLPEAAKTRMARKLGKYQSSWIYRHPYVSGFGNGVDKKYHSGRVGQRQDDELINVIDLHTSMKRTYADEDRRRIYEWILTDQFLIGQLDPR